MRIAPDPAMKDTQNESLRSGAPSQSGDLGSTATEREKSKAAAASDRVDEASPQHADGGGESGNPPRSDRSIDQGMASTGAASQAEASARHATENMPEAGQTPKR
jgi:hypothetical protein